MKLHAITEPKPLLNTKPAPHQPLQADKF